MHLQLNIALYAALVSANIPEDKAQAVVDALENAMSDSLATKSDLQLLEQRLNHRVDSIEQKLEHKIDKLGLQLTVRLGGLMVVGIGIVLTAMRYMLMP
ncbi:hypothetical protein QCD60_19345 [Pokkaliibacter sp. MBI-7]|uniref:hypothetical protein n=1 Tax=Pokkaliibacter sp. MBI-7 TaxID=3040600 RepID=UPI00244D43EB|nr:hypothetical protein [Pokkaliibacter sp. MBI-7]MDH2430964.1 hypothetical protein [Pokkaliibacter sp. MBI-7]MDH2434704.1 hypothetical protein [Pokkaliibacter sp. MBI-7]